MKILCVVNNAQNSYVIAYTILLTLACLIHLGLTIDIMPSVDVPQLVAIK